MAKQLLGKEVTAALNERIKANVAELRGKGVNPTLCIIRVGENPSDISYERGATKRCETLGVACEKILLPEDVSQEELLATIDKVNKDDSIHGVLLFRPLPKHLDQAVIENALAPEKDVDCMTDLSMSGVFTGKKIGFPPCTPQACMEILDHYGIDCTGKKAVVIGRSLVVGKPAAMMLVKKNATVTICHTRTVDMPSVAREADIVIVAAGRAGVVGAEYVKEGQTIIDVGINVNAEGKLCGDVDYATVEPIVDAITPVYEEVTVCCNLRIKPGYPVGDILRQTEARINNCIAPWRDKEEIPVFGLSFSSTNLYNSIRECEAIVDIDILSVAHVVYTAKDQQKSYYLNRYPEEARQNFNVSPSQPWCILVPSDRHLLYIDQKDELLEQLGLGYLGVGSNFIINK